MRRVDDKPEVSRRTFMRSTAVAGACVAVATSAPALAAPGIAEGKKNQKKEEGYQLTQHVVDYYKSAAS